MNYNLTYYNKYLKYKKKYIILKNLYGGKKQKSWDVRDNKNFYINVEIDKDSFLGKEYITRLQEIKKDPKFTNIKIPFTGQKPFRLHTTLLEILIPDDNNLHLKLTEILKNDIEKQRFLNSIKEIYELYFEDAVAYSNFGKYECLGNFFVRLYDDTDFLTKIIDKYRNFKIMIIYTLLKYCGLNCDNINEKNIKTDNYTYYFDKNNNPLFAIKKFFYKPNPINNTGWIPHISMIKDVDKKICSNIKKFLNTHKVTTHKSLKRTKSQLEQFESLRLLPFWNKNIKKEFTYTTPIKTVTKILEGSISNILFVYDYKYYEITF